jgi:hypothetical protein
MAIYRFLNRNSVAVRHIGALALWNRRLLSLIFLIVIETFFLIAFSLRFWKACILCLGIGSLITISAIHDAYPRNIAIFEGFDVYPRPADAPDRVRSVKEISAYLTTILSFWMNPFPSS